MKRFLLMLCVLTLTGFSMLMAEIPVTWQVDMSVKVAEESFTIGTDNVTLRGSFMNELGCSGDWFPDEGAYVLSNEDGDSVYTLTLNFPDSLVNTAFEYKYQINDANWETGNNHAFTLISPSTVIPVEYFDRDSIITRLCVNFLQFELDLSGIYGSGLGFFDPTTDSVKIMGFWGDGVAQELSEAEDYWCTENVWQPGLYETMIIIKAEAGKNPEFKAKTYPEDHFENWGWEIYDNHSFTVLGDSETVTIAFVPDIIPYQYPLASDVTILFAVDMNNAVNRNSLEPIDPSTLTHVGLKGQNEVIGAWGGDWTLADTTDGDLILLNDLGLNGDKVAGDNIWSRNVTFAAGITGGPCLYKYGAYYPGADSLSSFDNEMVDTDDNHYVYIAASGVTELNDIFGVASKNGIPENKVTSENRTLPIKPQLHQNYPNPFNPTTQISFDLPKDNNVTVTVYNLLGKQVAVLIDNKNMKSGYHTVNFDGRNLASGVYFVNLCTPQSSQVCKMLLLK